MSYAWEETLSALDAELGLSLKGFLQRRPGEGMGDTLQRLMKNYPTAEHRLWFSVLDELYQSGAGLVDVVRSIAEALRDEQARDLEAHIRNLPTVMNVILILFFFPPTMLLIFAPLLFELTHLFAN